MGIRHEEVGLHIVILHIDSGLALAFLDEEAAMGPWVQGNTDVALQVIAKVIHRGDCVDDEGGASRQVYKGGWLGADEAPGLGVVNLQANSKVAVVPAPGDAEAGWLPFGNLGGNCLYGQAGHCLPAGGVFIMDEASGNQLAVWDEQAAGQGESQLNGYIAPRY